MLTLRGSSTSLLVWLASLVVTLLPLFPQAWVIGVMMAGYPKAFNPTSRTSIYSPEFRRKTSVVLLVLAILEGLTGFGAGPQTSSFVTDLTLGLLTRGISLELHLALIAPLALFFVIHTVSGLGSLLILKGVKRNWVYQYLLPGTWIGLYLLTVYLDLNYFLS